MKLSGKKVLKNFIITFIALYLIQVLLAIGSDSTTAFFKEMTRTIPIYWQITIFITIATVLVLIITLLEDKEESEGERTDHRTALLNIIKGQAQDQLKDKLTGELLFSLNPKVRFSDENVSDELKNKLNTRLNAYSPGSFEELMDSYLNQVKRMVILGDAGSGKTSLLLKMHVALTELAREDKDFPIPLIFEVADFNQEIDTYTNDAELGSLFIKWLKKSATAQFINMGMNQRQANALVETYGFMPILDGLDEIETFRYNNENFLLALNQYLTDRKVATVTRYPEIILTCRTEDFFISGFRYHSAVEQGSWSLDRIITMEELPFNGILYIDPVADIREVLAQLQQKDPNGVADRLLRSIETYPHLAVLLHTSFHIHMALHLAKNGHSFKDVSTTDDLLGAYIVEHIHKTNYPKPDAIQWIGQIAGQSQNIKVAEFDILPAFRYLLLVTIVFRVLLLLLPGFLLTETIMVLISKSDPWIFYSIWLVWVLLLSLFFYQEDSYRTFRYDPQRVHQRLRQKLYICAIVTLMNISLFCYFPYYIFYYAATLLIAVVVASQKFNPPTFQILSLQHARKALFSGLYSWIMLALIMATSFYLLEPGYLENRRTGTVMNKLSNVHTDTGRIIINTLKTMVIVGFASIVSSELVTWHLNRIALYVSGQFRKNPLKFIHEMTTAGLFTKSGDFYRFRHVLIKEWFQKQQKSDSA